MKKLDFRPIARRTRQQTEAEMLKKLNEEKRKRKQRGNMSKSQSLGGLAEVQGKNTDESSKMGNRSENLRLDNDNVEGIDMRGKDFDGDSGIELVVLDDSEDDVKFIDDRDRGDDMKGEVFPLDDDDDDVGHNDGFSAGSVKVESDCNIDYGGFISESKMGVEIKMDESCYGVELIRETNKGKAVLQPRGLGNMSTSGLDFDGEKNEDDNGTDSEIISISEEDSAEVEFYSDKEDEDYIDNSDAESSGVESSESSDSVEEMSSKEEREVEKDDEEDDVFKEVGKEEEVGVERDDGEDESGVRLKRKKRKASEILFSEGKKDGHVDCGDTDDSFQGGRKPNYVAKRTRSHHTSEPGMQRKSGKRSIKRKRTCAYKEVEVVRILADSILDQEEAPFEEENEPVKEPTLPLKFTFGVEESTPLEKSEEEEELEKLWAEFDIVLWSLNSTDNGTVEEETDISPELEADTATLCLQGKHNFILDEEVGFKCKYCCLVGLEIRYCVPAFSTNPSGRSARRDHATTQHNILDGFNHQDSNSQPDCDPNNHSQGTVWDVIPGIGKGMHEHQREGFEFLWKNIAGGINLDALKETTSSRGGSGCIISHAPGTGKTRLAIVFIQTYMKLYPTCRPVIIAPRSMLFSWEAEFRKWGVDIPFHNLNKEDFSNNENQHAMNFLKQLKSRQCSVTSIRMVKLYSWKQETSILGISYGLFEKLAGEDKGNSRASHMIEGDRVRKALLELPGLLVLDEGHTPRNKQSLIWKALSKVRTQRRIMLSGTPFQNNFDQLYNTLYLVNPKFADEISSKHNRDFHKNHGLKENESRCNWFSLTNPLGKVIDDGAGDARLKEVRKVIRTFVHVHKGTILQEKLPGLRESLVILEPVGLQKRLLDGLQNMKRQLTFNLDNWISSVSVHPSLLKESSETEELQVDWDELKRLQKNPNASVKTHFLMELIHLSESTNEKVLVFCQYLPPLNLICKQLKSQFSWAKGKEVLYMDGALATNKRQSLIKHFNDPQNISKVLLASTKACCEGISLVGASRVVLLDVVWNPSVETQAISRAYRLGQEKVVYVYHLVTSGEEEKYCRQVRKDRLSELVFYSADNAGNGKKISSDISDDSKDRFLEAMVEHERLKYMVKKIIYEPKDSSLVKSFGLTDL